MKRRAAAAWVMVEPDRSPKREIRTDEGAEYVPDPSRNRAEMLRNTGGPTMVRGPGKPL